MVNIKIHPFAHRDLLVIEPGDQFPEVKQINMFEASHILKYQMKYSTTLKIDDKPIIIGGLNPINCKEAFGFLLLSKDFPYIFRKYPKLISNSLKNYLNNTNFDKIYALCYNYYIEGQKFLEFLGFKKHDNLQNMIKYVRVKR